MNVRDLVTEWIRGSDLREGMTILRPAGGTKHKAATITFIKWHERPWFLDGAQPGKVHAAQVETDANFTFTAYPSDHYQRVIQPGEQGALL